MDNSGSDVTPVWTPLTRFVGDTRLEFVVITLATDALAEEDAAVETCFATPGNWPLGLRNGCREIIATLWRRRLRSAIQQGYDESDMAGEDSLRPCTESIVKCP